MSYNSKKGSDMYAMLPEAKEYKRGSGKKKDSYGNCTEKN